MHTRRGPGCPPRTRATGKGGRVARLALPLVAILLPGGPVLAQQSDADWLADCEERSRRGSRVTHCAVQVERVAHGGGTIGVEGAPNGAVAIRAWDRPDVEVHARIEGRAESEARARELAEAVRIAHADAAIRAEGPAVGRNESWNVGFVLYVPQRSDLRLDTRNGPLSIAGVTGRMELETENGPISLNDVGGDVRARTRNGPITVRLAGVRWEGSGLDAETANGPIAVHIPDGYSARLEAGTTNGPMSTDVPLQVTLMGRNVRHVETVLGDGGAPLRLVTRNGPLAIRRP